MEIDALFIQRNEAMLMGVAAMLCGTALLHLLLIRMIRKRGQEKDHGKPKGDGSLSISHPPVFFPEPI